MSPFSILVLVWWMALFVQNTASAQIWTKSSVHYNHMTDQDFEREPNDQDYERYPNDSEGGLAEPPHPLTPSPKEESEPVSPSTNSTSTQNGGYNDGWGSSRPHGVDILVATFFLVAAGWLFMAILYSLLILIVLRLQSRGELDLYDENFGRIFFCNGRFSINCGCILRRYAIQLEEEQQRRSRASIQGHGAARVPPRRVRIMTRVERREAVESLLGKPAQKSVKVQVTTTRETKEQHVDCCHHCDDDQLVEGPVCSICLGEYGKKKSPKQLTFLVP
jgi:hypothetical protein